MLLLFLCYPRLLQRQDDDRLIRTEFVILLCPDECLSEQIRTFSSELLRHFAKETLLQDRQHLRAFKLTSFFHVIVYKCKLVFNILLEF